MSAHVSRSRTSRFEEIEIADGEVVIYDAENHRAWIQSDNALDCDEMA